MARRGSEELRTDLLVLRYPTKGAAKVLDRRAKRLPNGFRVALDALTDLHYQALVDATPEGETGQLRGGWRIRKSGRGGVARSVIGNVYGARLRFVLGGTRAHIIRAKHLIASGPRKGQPGYLLFRGRGGEDVFARQVHHPGTKPNPFHRTALRAARARASEQMRQVLVRTLRV